jgi:hypothetical protein
VESPLIVREQLGLLVFYFYFYFNPPDPIFEKKKSRKTIYKKNVGLIRIVVEKIK